MNDTLFDTAIIGAKYIDQLARVNAAKQRVADLEAALHHTGGMDIGLNTEFENAERTLKYSTHRLSDIAKALTVVAKALAAQ